VASQTDFQAAKERSVLLFFSHQRDLCFKANSYQKSK